MFSWGYNILSFGMQIIYPSYKVLSFLMKQFGKYGREPLLNEFALFLSGSLVLYGNMK
jgi:hypothetical protein